MGAELRQHIRNHRIVGLGLVAGLLATACGGGLAAGGGGGGGGGGGTSGGPAPGGGNAPPLVTLDEDTFVQAADQRLGLVVPFTVSDDEGDTVQLVFQWTRAGEAFPAIPADPDDLAAALADPTRRRALRIATAYPSASGGRLGPRGPAVVELPELAGSQAALLGITGSATDAPALLAASDALTGLELQLLRNTTRPQTLASDWITNPLNNPVAALPDGDGTTAIVLDQTPGGLSRLRRLDLSNGAVLADLASGTAEPDALALEGGGQAVLIAEHNASVWRVQRLDLTSLSLTQLFDVASPGGSGLRGLVSLGTGAALVTVDDTLLRLNYLESPATLSTVLDGLATPGGLVLDPTDPQTVLLAEQDSGGGRVLAVSLASRSAGVVAADAPGLPFPMALALEDGGARLLVLTDEDPNDGTRELRALQRFGGATPDLTVLADDLPDSARGLSCGPRGLRLIALGAADDLSAGGGIQQRRTVSGYDPATRQVTVSEAFSPVPSSGQPWRLILPATLPLQAGITRSGVFLWDSSDLPGGQGTALLRLNALDEGTAVTSHQTGKAVVGGLSSLSGIIGGAGTSDGTQALAVVDLNGDGALDLVSANAVGDRIAIFFQQGPGTFAPTPLLLGSSAVTNFPADVCTADLDGDGDADIVAANGGSDVLTIFFQTAPGVFDFLPAILGGPGATDTPLGIATADLNEDGAVDIVSANSGGDDLALFFQPSPSGLLFLTVGNSNTSDGPRDVAVGDLDGDGDIDIVSANAVGDSLTAFFHAGGGFFGATPLSLSSAPFLNGPFGVLAADLDGDGDLDLASANALSNNVTVFRQTAPGVFAATPESLGDATTTLGPRGLSARDIDGDGVVELLTANTAGNTLSVFSQTAGGTFDPVPTMLGGSGVTDGPRSVTVADIDGDGDGDVLSTDSAGDRISVFSFAGPGLIDDLPLPLGGPATTAAPFAVIVADLNGDGSNDLASANQTSNTLSVFFQTSPGAFATAPLAVGGPATTNGPRGLVAADFDGDGALDLASANSLLDTLTIFHQVDDGVFASTPLTLGGDTVTDFPTDVDAGDFDGDGLLDIVSSNGAGDTLTVFFQSQGGAFDPLPFVLGATPDIDFPADLGLGDLDGDGDLDIVSANSLSDNLTVYLHLAGGVFDTTPLVLGDASVTDTALSVCAADIDRDGDLDLLSANTSSASLTIFRQLSPGVFSAFPQTVAGSSILSGPRSVVVVDLDGDGDLDLASANLGDDTVTVFRQVSPGKFTPTPLVLGGAGVSDGPLSIAAGDIDGDGDPDLVTANNSGDNLTVFFSGHGP